MDKLSRPMMLISCNLFKLSLSRLSLGLNLISSTNVPLMDQKESCRN